jgi:cytidine deaminase
MLAGLPNFNDGASILRRDLETGDFMAAKNGITRRTAIEFMATSAIGLTMMGPALADDDLTSKLQKTLPKFRDESLALLRRSLEDPSFRGSISAKNAATLCKNENLSADDLMLALLPLAKSYARAPISNFLVGVVVRGASGNLYLGSNVEIPGQCLGFAVHGEQSALSKAYMNSEDSVPALAVIGGAPCGHCRQFMEEISPDGAMLILVPNKSPVKLSSILPDAFGPAALGAKQGALPIRKMNLALIGSASDALATAALDAARRSYAPYSQSPSGVAIRTTRDQIYQGCYIENVAFNPSLSPLQTALAQMIAAGEPYSAISAVTLVEPRSAKISQKTVTETVLAALAPSVKLNVVSAYL